MSRRKASPQGKQLELEKKNHDRKNNNLLLTGREGRTEEYWLEVVAVRSVRTKTTEGQYSQVRLKLSRY